MPGNKEKKPARGKRRSLVAQATGRKCGISSSIVGLSRSFYDRGEFSRFELRRESRELLVAERRDMSARGSTFLPKDACVEGNRRVASRPSSFRSRRVRSAIRIKPFAKGSNSLRRPARQGRNANALTLFHSATNQGQNITKTTVLSGNVQTILATLSRTGSLATPILETINQCKIFRKSLDV